jgi:hypothetical protein
MKQKLNKKIKEVINQIKTNSKDQHYANTLINELMSLKGQLDIEPTLIHLPLDEVVSKIEGENFRICVCKGGEAVYHMKGGVDIVVQPSANSLYSYLVGMTQIQDELEKLSDEEKELIHNDIMASTYVLNIPFLAFGDLDFKYKLTNIVLDYLAGLNEKMINEAELQDETPAQDAAFEEAVVAIEDMVKQIGDGEKNSIQ